jgi:uridine phosphorylase
MHRSGQISCFQLHFDSNWFYYSYLMDTDNYFNKSNALITPSREKGEQPIGPDALMVAIPSELAFLEDLVHAERATLATSNPFKLFLAKRNNDLPLALAGPLLGAPQGVMAMEKLIALGAKRIWVLGWCGSLQPNLLIGDLIIPTTALSEEGTSAHYPVKKKIKETNPLLNTILADALVKAHLSFRTGPVWTTDAIYRETVEKVTDYGKKGLLAVDMEMSALITVALFRSVQLAGLLIVSDELFSLKWRPGFGTKILKKRSREAGRVLLDVCMNDKLGVQEIQV